MRLSQIEEKARSLGVKNTWQHSRKALIREIQRREGNAVCFSTGRRACDQLNCCWRRDCFKNPIQF